jgi:hypothetical protein
VLQPQEWGQVNAPYEEVRAHVTTDLLWLKDWLHRRIGTRSLQKQPIIPLKVLISHNFISFMYYMCLLKLLFLLFRH